jgi:hypothetical protein
MIVRKFSIELTIQFQSHLLSFSLAFFLSPSASQALEEEQKIGEGELFPNGTESVLYFHGFASSPGPGFRPMGRNILANIIMGKEVDKYKDSFFLYGFRFDLYIHGFPSIK